MSRARSGEGQASMKTRKTTASFYRRFCEVPGCQVDLPRKAMHQTPNGEWYCTRHWEDETMTARHTPGPCGCDTRYAVERQVGVLPPIDIIYCPTHALAPEMADAIREMVAAQHAWERGGSREAPRVRVAHEQLRALLARLEGR
jgi:hypothetical protein